MTALRCLHRLAGGERDVLLIHGASGGVGGFAVQIARERRVRIIGTCSERNLEYVQGLGAEPVVYGDGLADRVREMIPDGVTAVADFAGGQLETTLAVLAKGGRHVSVADPSVEEHGGAWVWVRPDGAKLAELADLAERGALTVEVAETFPLERVGEAFDASRSSHTRGKLVVTP
jgi:NADPH:quinone reductase-like Zn-dependent oxidoreductase